MKRYMVIERFAPGAKDKVYERFKERGRKTRETLDDFMIWETRRGSNTG